MDDLRKQPRRLQRLCKKWHVASLSKVREFHPDYGDAADETIVRAKLFIVDCKLVLAREAGFEDWQECVAAARAGAVVVAAPTLPDFFIDNDVAAAKALLAREPGIVAAIGYRAHPMLEAFANRNLGRSGGAVAELLSPPQVLAFRDAVESDRVDDVRELLECDPALAVAQFPDRSQGSCRACRLFACADEPACSGLEPRATMSRRYIVCGRFQL
jgi:hypothetical protein